MRTERPKIAWIIFSAVILLCGFVSSKAQNCYLSVFVTEAVSGGDFKAKLFARFETTLIDLRSNETYKPKRDGTYVNYKNLPSAEYEITVAYPGYKTSKRTHSFVCDANSPFDSVNIIMYPGEQNLSVQESDESRRVPIFQGDSGVLILNGGILNPKALRMIRPHYAPTTVALRASGDVNVRVLIDELGNVVTAKAIDGNQFLRASAELAAKKATFSPIAVDGKLFKVSGVLSYRF